MFHTDLSGLSLRALPLYGLDFEVLAHLRWVQPSVTSSEQRLGRRLQSFSQLRILLGLHSLLEIKGISSRCSSNLLRMHVYRQTAEALDLASAPAEMLAIVAWFSDCITEMC